MRELGVGNRHFATLSKTMDLGNNLQQLPKPVSEQLMRNFFLNNKNNFPDRVPTLSCIMLVELFYQV